jgi:protein-S-isoprenylcysteine O-methyltransferase Ste14
MSSGSGQLKKIYSRSDQANRKDLAGEHPLNDLVQIILIVIFLVVWIADSFFLKMTTFAAGYVPLYLRILLGIFFIFLWYYLVKRGLGIIFGEEREVPSVITKGPFAYVRHPIYLASVLLYLGLSCFTFSLASFFVTLTAALYYNVAASYEEKMLVKKYGKQYEEYAAHVGKWIPKFRRLAQ